MRDPDQQFFDIFTLVLAILIGSAVVVFVIARAVAEDTQGQYVLEDSRYVALANSRIEPAGHIIIAGSDELAAARAAPVSSQAESAEPLTGQEVYDLACSLCHVPPAGVAGAPPLGDAAAWAERIAKGMDVLTANALNGFQGSTGVMPAKGGRLDLSDEEIIGAVEFMVEQVSP